jgi:hypothetical protein
MSASRAVRRLDPETAAYMAGLVDGEGTITLTSQHRTERRRLVVSISNTDRSLLAFVMAAVGAGCISAKRVSDVRHAPGFTFKVTSRQALDLLAQIAPYLRTYRALRAQMALQRYLELTPRNGKYCPQTLRDRTIFEREFLALGPGPHSGRPR